MEPGCKGVVELMMNSRNQIHHYTLDKSNLQPMDDSLFNEKPSARFSSNVPEFAWHEYCPDIAGPNQYSLRRRSTQLHVFAKC